MPEVNGRDIRSVVIACDAGMGSSVMVASQMRNRLKPYHVTVEGLPGAEVLVEDVRLRSTESRVVPLIVRVPQQERLARTVPLYVHVQSTGARVVLETTFKSGSAIDATRKSRP